jgi:hypothetical protein
MVQPIPTSIFKYSSIITPAYQATETIESLHSQTNHARTLLPPNEFSKTAGTGPLIGRQQSTLRYLISKCDTNKGKLAQEATLLREIKLSERNQTSISRSHSADSQTTGKLHTNAFSTIYMYRELQQAPCPKQEDAAEIVCARNQTTNNAYNREIRDFPVRLAVSQHRIHCTLSH